MKKLKVSRFDQTPADIFELMVLFISIENILDFVEKICKQDPERSNRANFWKLLWKRDINDNVPDNVKEKYLEFVTFYNKEKWLRRKIETAVKFGAIKILPDLLISQEVDIFPDKKWLFNLAAMHGHIDIMKYLISQGYDIDVNAALIYTAINGHLNIVEFLVLLGADISAYQNQPFSAAISNRHFDVADYLISKGADINAYNCESFKVAVRNNKLDTVEFLVSHGAKIVMDNFNALEQAVYYNYIDMAKYLISQGMNPNVLNPINRKDAGL